MINDTQMKQNEQNLDLYIALIIMITLKPFFVLKKLVKFFFYCLTSFLIERHFFCEERINK